MKTFVISLERSKKRRIFIQRQLTGLHVDFEMINAVDGQNLSENQLAELCDMEQVRKFPGWLTRGAIGCALSHRLAYERIVNDNLRHALILEDDIQLPSDILNVLKKLETAVEDDEVVLLYYQNHGELRLSNVDTENIGPGELMYPMRESGPITTAAYIIGNKAAKNLLHHILPVRVCADSWAYFYKEGYIKSIRCLYPLKLKVNGNFKSSIDYIDRSSWLGQLLNFIDTYTIPPFYQILAWRRKSRLNKMLGIRIVTDRSPLAKKNN